MLISSTMLVWLINKRTKKFCYGTHHHAVSNVLTFYWISYNLRLMCNINLRTIHHQRQRLLFMMTVASVRKISKSTFWLNPIYWSTYACFLPKFLLIKLSFTFLALFICSYNLRWCIAFSYIHTYTYNVTHTIYFVNRELSSTKCQCLHAPHIARRSTSRCSIWQWLRHSLLDKLLRWRTRCRRHSIGLGTRIQCNGTVCCRNKRWPGRCSVRQCCDKYHSCKSLKTARSTDNARSTASSSCVACNSSLSPPSNSTRLYQHTKNYCQ